MTTVDSRKVLRNGLIGFGLGLLFMLGIGFVVPSHSAPPRHASASAR